MLQRQGSRYKLYPYNATYTDNGKEITKYALPSKEWWEETTSKHDHLEIIEFTGIEVTEAMQKRFKEIERMPEDFTSVYIDYVKDGTLPDEFPENHPFHFIILRNKDSELSQENINLMMSLTDQYEKNLKLEQDNTNTMLALTDLYEQMNGGV